MDNVSHVAAASGGNTFVITNCGELWGWGLNHNSRVSGLIGVGGTNTYQTTPVRVMSDVAYMTITGPFGDVRFAITNDGEVWSWRQNSLAAAVGRSASLLGDGTNEHRSAPVRVLE